MNRLQKKCFFASAGFHLLLGGILLIGPAFLTSQPKPEDAQIINFIPLVTTDEKVSGGGSPSGGNPPPRQAPDAQPPKPPLAAAEPAKPAKAEVPEPEPPKKPAPKKPAAKVITPPDEDSDSLEVAKKTVHKIVVNTTPVVRKPTASTTAAAEAKARAAAREAEQARESAEQSSRISSALGRAVSNIEGSLSGSTEIKLKGPGGGGVPYANWLWAVKSLYTEAWTVPDGVADDSASVTATVTIARDGTVVSARISRTSGNALVDDSVRAALNRVRTGPPLPESSSQDQRTVSINFNVKSKRLLG